MVIDSDSLESIYRIASYCDTAVSAPSRAICPVAGIALTLVDLMGEHSAALGASVQFWMRFEKVGTQRSISRETMR